MEGILGVPAESLTPKQELKVVWCSPWKGPGRCTLKSVVFISFEIEMNVFVHHLSNFSKQKPMSISKFQSYIFLIYILETKFQMCKTCFCFTFKTFSRLVLLSLLWSKNSRLHIQQNLQAFRLNSNTEHLRNILHCFIYISVVFQSKFKCYIGKEK